MIYYVDVDNTICLTKGTNYLESIPIYDNIKKINKLYDEGNEINYYTSRGVGSKKDLLKLTMSQFKNWGCKYHGLNMNKPIFDKIIDDKAMRIEEL